MQIKKKQKNFRLSETTIQMLQKIVDLKNLEFENDQKEIIWTETDVINYLIRDKYNFYKKEGYDNFK